MKKFLPKSILTRTLLLGLVFLFYGSIQSFGQIDIRNDYCGTDYYSCTSENFTVHRIYLINANTGEELAISNQTCIVGYDVDTVSLGIEFTSNQNGDIYQARLFADLFIDGNEYQSDGNGGIEPAPDASGFVNIFLGTVPGKDNNYDGTGITIGTTTYGVLTLEDVLTFEWHCGEEVSISDFFTAWAVNNGKDYSVNYDCSSFNKSQCEFNSEIYIEAPLSVGFDSEPCQVGSETNVQFISQVYNGTAPYTYSWIFKENGIEVETSTVENPTFVFDGTEPYTAELIVTDATSITNNPALVQTITPPDELSIQSIDGDVISCDNNNDTITVNAAGGTGALKYSLDDGTPQDENYFVVTSSGTYTVAVTDENNCTTSSSIIIGDEVCCTLDIDCPSQLNYTVSCPSEIPPAATDEAGLLALGFNIVDYCGTLHVQPTTDDIPNCEGVVNRIYTITDDNNNTLQCTLVYTIDYSGGLTNLPADDGTTVSCPADAVDPGTPGTIKDACSRDVVPVLVGRTPAEGPDCEGSVVWTYRYTTCDGATYDWKYTYTIDYSGGLTNLPADDGTTVSCPADALVQPAAPATIQDACDRDVAPVLVGHDPAPDCNGDVVWTWSYTACDLTTVEYYTHTYHIVKDNPIVTCPGDQSRKIADAATHYTTDGTEFDLVSVTIDCGTPADTVVVVNQIEYDLETLAGFDLPVGKDTITWKVTDNCGNTGECTFYVTITRSRIPYYPCTLPPLVMECGENYDSIIQAWVDTALVVIEREAEDDDPITADMITHDYNGVLPPVECDANTALGKTVTFTITDDYGNSTTCSKKIIILDLTPPTIDTEASDLVVECNGEGNNGEFAQWLADHGDAVASDICSEVSWSYVINDTTNICGGADSVSVTFTAEDDCGNKSTSDAAFVIKDRTPPLFTAPRNITIYTDANCNFDASISLTGDVTDEADNCSNGLEATFVDQDTIPLENCEGGYTITRIWSLLDDCGNKAQDQTQLITIVDNIPPTFTVPADTIIHTDICLDMDVSPEIFGNVTNVADNCTEVPTIDWKDIEMDCFGSASSVNIDAGTGKYISFEVDGFDDLKAHDIEKLRLSFETNKGKGRAEFTLISPSGQGIMLVGSYCDDTEFCNTDSVQVFSPIFYPDSLGNEIWENSKDLPTGEANYTPYGATGATPGYTVNGLTAGVVDKFEDLTGPMNGTWTIYGRKQVLTNGKLKFIDVCLTPAWEKCGNNDIISRLWTVTDNCGNETSALQVIQLIDTTPPGFVENIPAEITVDCDAVPEMQDLTAIDSCGEIFDVIKTQDTISYGDCPSEMTILRTWTAADACENTSSVSQLINVQDTTPPMLDAAPADTIVDCNAVPVMAEITASDLCDESIEVTTAEIRVDGECENSYTLYRTWYAEDLCGNIDSVMQTITVQDTTPPMLDAAPADTIVDCNAVPVMAEITASDLCDESIEVTTAEIRVDGECDNSYTLYRTWYAEDLCGNIDSVMQTITVQDTTPPSLIANAIIPEGDLGIDACLAEMPEGPSEDAIAALYTDNCGTVTVIKATNSGENSDCNWSVTYNYTIEDECGNFADEVNITYSGGDNTAPVLTGTLPQGETGINACTSDMPEGPTEETIAALYTDACGDVTVTKTGGIGEEDTDCSWSVTYTYTIEDECGNFANEVNITYSGGDATPPTIVCPEDVTVNVDANDPDAIVNIPLPTVFDACGDVTYYNNFTNTEDASAIYPIGDTEVTYYATDDCGNIDSCKFTVSVLCEGQTRVDGVVYVGDLSGGQHNVMVTLIPQGNTPGETQMSITNTKGQYAFVNMVPGEYLVQVQDANLNAKGLFNVNSSLFFTTVVDCEFQTHNFEYEEFDGPAIGDLVWYDVNQNGVQDEWFDANNDGVVTQNFPDFSNNGYVDFSLWEWIDMNGDGSYEGPENEGELNKAGVGNSLNANIIITGLNNFRDSVIVGILGYYRSRPESMGEYTVALDFDVNLSAAAAVRGRSGLVKELPVMTKSAGIPLGINAKHAEYDSQCGVTSDNPQLAVLVEGAAIDLTKDFGVACTPATIEVFDMTVECDGNGNLEDFETFIAQFSVEGLPYEITVDSDTTEGCGLTRTVETTGIVTGSEFGNDTVSAVFRIEDTTPPTFTAPADITVYSGENCQVDTSTVATGDASSESDICSATELNATYTDLVEQGSCAGELIITRKWTLADACENQAEPQVQIITVLDTVAPVISCNDITVQLNANGVATITVDDINGGSTDNCGIDTIFIDRENFYCGGLGANEVTLTAIDECGNVSTCTATVTVEEGDYDCGVQPFRANADILTLIYCPGGTVSGDIDLFANDEGFSRENVSFNILTDLPEGVSVTDGELLYVNEDANEAVITFTYQVCHTVNTDNCDTAEVTIHILLDTDCDGVPDIDDIDDDDDGILDIIEEENALNQETLDSDGDGIVDRLDIDSDNDGIPDNIEWQSTIAEGGEYDYILPLGTDTNGDGWDDAYDPEDNGITYEPWDMDIDGTPDYLDLDTDDDGIEDAIEGYDANSDGIADVSPLGQDSDNDGLDDAYDTYDTSEEWLHGQNAIGSDASLQDTDDDGLRDWRDNTDDSEGPENFACGQPVIPNAFSPNQDGYNDYFKVMVYCTGDQGGNEERVLGDDFPEARIEIFNRWGNLIYEKERYGNIDYWGEYDAWWDGTSMHDMQIGKDQLPTGTYFYILYFNADDGRDPITGFIFLNN